MTSLPAIFAILSNLFTQFASLPAPEKVDAVTPANCKAGAQANFDLVAAAVKDNPDFWTAPFVLADIKNGQVTVWGQHTGMAVGEPLEFFVIAENSGHDYESMMMAFAKPSDLHQALEKIGAKPGGSVSPDIHRFWPRGSRMVAEIEWQPNGAAQALRMPIEKSARYNGEPMPLMPWIFTGAPMLPDLQNEGKMVYAADHYSPNSIAATFNLQNTVFDLPLQGSKTQTYGSFMRDPTYQAPEGKPMLLHLRLARENEVPKEFDLQLQFRGVDAQLTTTGMDNLPTGGLAELGAFLNQRENEIYYLQPDLGPEISLAKLTQLGRELQLLETHVSGLRIEPPIKGQLFFKAFVPDPRFRGRDKRPSQPLELHLTPNDATLITLDEIWGDAASPAIVENRILLNQPDELLARLKNPNIQKPVLFIYADGSLTHGDMSRWIAGVLDQFPIVFVYLNEN